MTENELSYRIIGAAIKLHRALGPGLLESAYEAALCYDLIDDGLKVRHQVAMPFMYKNIRMDVGYRVDLIVEEKVIVEIKAIEDLAPVHFAQVLTYLKLSNLKLALLINFNAKTLRQHIHRIVNNL